MTPAHSALRVATVGNPNVGKTSLINAVAGSDLSVGNWPGTTVDRLSVQLTTPQGLIDWVDLPGTYSLVSATSEESITRQELLLHPPDVIINVLDAGNLERNLGLTLELSELGIPMVIVLNLIDEAAKRGILVDGPRLAQALGLPVIATVASRRQGCEALVDLLWQERSIPGRLVAYPEYLEAALQQLRQQQPQFTRWQALQWLNQDGPGCSLRQQVQVVQDPFFTITEARLQTAQRLAQEVELREPGSLSHSDRIDRWLLHPWLGIPLFLLGMLGVFRFTYLFSDPWIQYLDIVKAVLSGWVISWQLPELPQSFLCHGVIDGAGTVAAFSPVLFLLYLALAFLEASGLLARTTFLFDQVMQWVGLPGRSLIPLLLGFGCNVPAVYAARILPNLGDRLRVALAIPFMACSARLTVFVLFAAVFFPRQAPYVVLALYLLGLALGLLTAKLLKPWAPSDQDQTGVMEMPPYRFPTWNCVVRQAQLRTWSFLKDAGGPILGAVLLVWALHQFPSGRVEDSLYAQAARGIGWLLSPLGIQDWRLAGALMPGFIAKEVVIGSLGVSYLGEEPIPSLGLLAGLSQLSHGLWEALQATVAAVPQLLGLPSAELPPQEGPGGLSGALAKSCSPAAALAYLVFLLIYTPCVATLAAIKNEFGSRWAWFSLIWQLSVAWIAGWLVYQGLT